MSAEHKIQHEYFAPPDFSKHNPDSESWFNKYGLSAPSLAFTYPDVRVSRYVIASMLAEVWNRELFYIENDYMRPQPDELDRLLLISWLQFTASTTGLLNGEEIRRIQKQEGLVAFDELAISNVEQPPFEELVKRTKKWKAENETIGAFIGSFDPPTATHLGCATDAYTRCDHLIIGFDNDASLKKRKGKDRPRYSLETRRNIFGNFWMVDGTFVLHANGISDTQSYVDDYIALNVDYVFLSQNQDGINNRLKQIELAGAQPKYLTYQGGEFSASYMLKKAKQWGFINLNLK